MTAAELRATEDYTGICAIRLFSRESPPRLVGIFIIDLTASDKFDCVAEASKRRPVTTFLAGCEKLLAQADYSRTEA